MTVDTAQAEQERLEKEQQKRQMKELKRELELAAKKEDEKALRVAQANYQNKLAIDAQIREKQRQKEAPPTLIYFRIGNGFLTPASACTCRLGDTCRRLSAR